MAEAKKQDVVEEVVTTEVTIETDTKTAKAGKRSAKAIAEKEAEIAKEERKSEAKADEDKPKQPSKPARSRLQRRGKNYRAKVEKLDLEKEYTLKEAVAVALEASPTKFDATVEVHVRLGVDPRHADQNIRDNIVLPAGTGKTVRVAVFADEDIAKVALKAGADIAGSETFLAQLDKGVIDFDVLIATPSTMAKLAKYARTLGPKGLMPNPKSGTVTNDVAKAVEQAKAGKIEYRVDSTGIVHVGIGKVSFGAAKILTNVEALFASIKGNKPGSIKGTYVRSITVTTTMGPGIKVAVSELS